MGNTKLLVNNELPLNRRNNIIGRIMGNIIIHTDNNKDYSYNGSGCWIWQGANSGIGRGGGYGRISINNCTSAVHIVVYTHFFGYVPNKKQLDHLCMNRLCCNPNHLELVSHKENQKRRRKN